jgi:hypothetical protein
VGVFHALAAFKPTPKSRGLKPKTQPKSAIYAIFKGLPLWAIRPSIATVRFRLSTAALAGLKRALQPPTIFLETNMKKHFLAALALAAATSAVQAAGVPLIENFDETANLAGKGWVVTNNSTTGGQSSWFQGNPGIFGSASGSAKSYIAANFLSAPATGGAISTWLMTPTIDIFNGETLSFALRLLGDGFLDTVEVYLSTSGASTNVGATTTSVGDFLLLQSFSADADTGWQDRSITLDGVAPGSTGRFAFRYLVADTTVNGNYVGIDSVKVIPEPASWALVALALAGAGLSRRRAA